MKPFLRWVGSKFRCHKEIINEFPITFQDYYEPFLGSGAIFFNLFNCKRIFRKAYLSDINKHLINCFIAVKDEPERVKNVLLTYLARNSEEFYYAMRPNVGTPAGLIYLNRAGFSSLYRVNKDGEFNVPYRKLDFDVMKKPISMDTDSIERCSAYLNRWLGDIRCFGFEKALTSVKSGDLVYIDMPYVPYNSDGFTAYDKTGFGLKDHKWLHNCLLQCKKRGAHVFLSNSITDVSKMIYGEPYKVISVGDSVKSTAVVKGKRLEGLWKY
jgi:DNA adenine methylase